MRQGLIQFGNRLDFRALVPNQKTFHTFGQQGQPERLLGVDAEKLWGDKGNLPPYGSWVLTIRSTILDQGTLNLGDIPIVPLEVEITPAAGAAQSRILCDANTDVTINAPSFTAAIRWQNVTQIDNAVFPGTSFVVPPLVRVDALAQWTVATANARRSLILPAAVPPSIGATPILQVPVPPFAERFAARSDKVSSLFDPSTVIIFASGYDFAGIPLARYSGTELLQAMSDRGWVPVPSRSERIFVSTQNAARSITRPWVADFELGL